MLIFKEKIKLENGRVLLPNKIYNGIIYNRLDTMLYIEIELSDCFKLIYVPKNKVFTDNEVKIFIRNKKLETIL